MNARADSVPRYRRMKPADLDAVLAIENRIYSHPWTRGNFADSLKADYHCWIVENDAALVGYLVIAIAAGEAHLLNLSVAADWQRQGHGSALLNFAVKLARDYGAERIFLEVRPSNSPALALYKRAGFNRVAVRRGYYPASSGREDALVLELILRR